MVNEDINTLREQPPVAWLIEHDGRGYGRRRTLVLHECYDPSRPEFWLKGEIPDGYTVTPLFPGEPLAHVRGAEQPAEQEPDRFCITTEDGDCVSDDPRCMHLVMAEENPDE